MPGINYYFHFNDALKYVSCKWFSKTKFSTLNQGKIKQWQELLTVAHQTSPVPSMGTVGAFAIYGAIAAFAFMFP
jgi:hypothetical protein